jgi:uncharacterized protein YdhG (YjbR/CyaY superfamily)
VSEQLNELKENTNQLMNEIKEAMQNMKEEINKGMEVLKNNEPEIYSSLPQIKFSIESLENRVQ